MARKTQHRPHGAFAGRLFGSFSGKEPPAHPVGVLTQPRPHGGLTGRRFGSFAGKGGVVVITDITALTGGTSISVSWSGLADEYRIDGGTATALPDGTSPDTITGLTANTEYNSPGLQLRYDGGDWSDAVEFGTLNEGEGGGEFGVDAEMAVTGASGAFSGTAQAECSAVLAATGDSGIFVGSAFSSAVAAAATTGASGAFSGSAFSSAVAAADIDGDSGTFSGSAGTGTSAELAATGGAGAFSGSAQVAALAAMAATGGDGAFAGSAYPLTEAELAAMGASGSFAGSAWVGAASEVWPDPAVVLVGIAYGPNGADYTGTLTAGLSAAQAAQLLDVWQRLGLDPANPLVTTSTSITAGGVQQTIAEVGVGVTVTRTP